jgi:hypothetical protein
VITLGSISAFSSITATYKKLNQKSKTFMDELMLVVVKGLFLLSTIGNIWINQFGF